jgi:hypothetical protein
MSAIHLSGQFNISFVHIPKTAGTSIGKWLYEHRANSNFEKWDDHPTLTTMLSGRQPDFAFCVVRNPWDRIVSFYHFLQNLDIVSAQPKLHAINNLNSWPSFEDWIQNIQYFKIFPEFWFSVCTQQVDWIDRCTILKYENLNNDFKIIQDYFNSNDSLPKLMVSEHTEYQKYYNTKTEKIIAKYFAEDIDYFKYKF